jgi:3-oxoacyl-(acyl-carrier-protein) synthase
MRRHVAISGIGAVSSAGRGVGALIAAIRQGACSLAPDAELRALGARCGLSGRVPGVDAAFAELDIEPSHRDFFARFSRIGAVAAFDAMASAGGATAPAIGRVLVGSAVGPMGELDACFRDTLRQERHPLRAHAITRVTPSFLATYLAGAIGATRGGRLVSSACVSALEALREAVDLVASGAEDACLVGAVDEDSPSTYWAFDAQRLLSHATEPGARTRALSGKAGGFVPTGGAAFFVVEAEEAALARGRTPAARIAGVTIRSEPRPASLAAFSSAAYRAALDDARAWRGSGFDLVLAHAPPTIADVDELGILDAAFDVVASRTPVRSFKSLFGYALGAAAAIDVALGVFQIENGEVLPNDVCTREPTVARFAASLEGGTQQRPVNRVLKTAYAQGGVAGALVLERAVHR